MRGHDAPADELRTTRDAEPAAVSVARGQEHRAADPRGPRAEPASELEAWRVLTRNMRAPRQQSATMARNVGAAGRSLSIEKTKSLAPALPRSPLGRPYHYIVRFAAAD